MQIDALHARLDAEDAFHRTFLPVSAAFEVTSQPLTAKESTDAQIAL